MKVSEFAQKFPLYTFDFTLPIRDQPRIYTGALLDQFPTELEPDAPYHAGGRGRPNRNQTLAHSQCATCHRVLRNDYFYTLPSMAKKNVVFSHCRECSRQLNATHYESRAEVIQARRVVIWQTLAAQCAVCGFDQHMSAMDLHHVEGKEHQITELIALTTLTLDAGRIETLMREAKQCIPLCSNCHRMLHAGALSLPRSYHPPALNLADLLTKLKSPG